MICFFWLDGLDGLDGIVESYLECIKSIRKWSDKKTEKKNDKLYSF